MREKRVIYQCNGCDAFCELNIPEDSAEPCICPFDSDMDEAWDTIKGE